MPAGQVVAFQLARQTRSKREEQAPIAASSAPAEHLPACASKVSSTSSTAEACLLLSERLVLGGGLRPWLGKFRPLRRGGSAAPGRGTSAVPRTPCQFLSPVLVVTGTCPTACAVLNVGFPASKWQLETANGGRHKAMPLPGRARQSKALAALVPPHSDRARVGTIRGALD